MFAFLTPYLQLIKYSLGVLAILFAGYLGYRFEHSRFVDYRSKIDALALTQEAKNKEIVKEQALINKGISNEYQAKLTAIKSMYGGMHNTSSSSMSPISNTPSSIDGTSSDPQFIEKCAMTTQQLESIQSWIREQTGL